MRFKVFPGLQNTLITAHFSYTIPIVSRGLNFVWSFVWSKINNLTSKTKTHSMTNTHEI